MQKRRNGSPAVDMLKAGKLKWVKHVEFYQKEWADVCITALSRMPLVRKGKIKVEKGMHGKDL